MKYYYDFKEELAEAISSKTEAFEAMVVTIPFLAICLFANSEVIASNWVQVLLMLITVIATVAIFAVSFLAVSSIDCVSKRNKSIAKYVAEFLITRKFVVGERAGID